MEVRDTARAPAWGLDPVSWALLAGHGLIWLAVLAFHPADAIGDDIARFVQIASAPGTLYRDVPVEYMPLEALLIRGLLDAPVGEVAVRVVVLSAVCDVLAFWLVGRLFGRPAGRAYLAIALPLQVFMIFRLDMVAVVLVLSALALAASGRRRTAGAICAVALLFKLWPVVLIPLLWRRAGRSGTALAGVLAIGGVLVWLAVSGVDAIRYVTSFRGATGWHIESTVGSLVSLLGADEPRFELGTMRVGSMNDLTTWGVRVVAFVALVAIWWRAHHREDALPEGLPSAAAVAALVACSPVASAQYLSWIVPWSAVAAVERRASWPPVRSSWPGVLGAASFLVYWEIAGDMRTLELLSVIRAFCVLADPGRVARRAAGAGRVTWLPSHGRVGGARRGDSDRPDVACPHASARPRVPSPGGRGDARRGRGAAGPIGSRSRWTGNLGSTSNGQHRSSSRRCFGWVVGRDSTSCGERWSAPSPGSCSRRVERAGHRRRLRASSPWSDG